MALSCSLAALITAFAGPSIPALAGPPIAAFAGPPIAAFAGPPIAAFAGPPIAAFAGTPIAAFAGTSITGPAGAASHGQDPSARPPAPRPSGTLDPKMARHCARLARQALAHQDLGLTAPATRSHLWPAVSVGGWAEVWTRTGRRRHGERAQARALGGRVGTSTDRIDGGAMLLATWTLSPVTEVRDPWAPEQETQWTSPSPAWTQAEETPHWGAIVSDPRRRRSSWPEARVDDGLGQPQARTLRARTRRRVHALCVQHHARQRAVLVAPTVEAARHQLLSIQRVRALLEAHLGGPLRSPPALGGQP